MPAPYIRPAKDPDGDKVLEIVFPQGRNARVVGVSPDDLAHLISQAQALIITPLREN